jgi:CubicO group peptidase (beta-lactamase class C family)
MRILFLLLFTISFSGFSFSQSSAGSAPKKITETSLVAGDPAAAGFSMERLKRIDGIIQSWIDDKKMNGAVALIARDGKIVYNKAFGYDDMEKKTPMKTDHIFRIASQTKAITSVAVMTLFEEGKFMLDEPVSKYIPAFKGAKVIDKFNLTDTTWTTVPANREVTIRDLLTHTSGIGYAQIGSKEANAMYAKNRVVGGIGVEGFVLGDVIKRLGPLPLFHQPGTKFTYGLNTDVLGYLVEVVSGMTLDQYFRKKIFEPLGMNDTYFYLPKNKYDRLVSLYTEDSTGVHMMSEEITIQEKFLRDYPKLNGTYFSGGGGLSSTIYDYAIFLQMLLNGGEFNGKRILSRNTVRMMTMNQLAPGVMGDDEFGLGFGLTIPRESAKLPLNTGSFEWGGMFATTYWVDPKEKLVALIYRNIWPTSFNAADRYKVMVYQALND